MAGINPTQTQHATHAPDTVQEKDASAHIERTVTNENDVAVTKVMMDAKVDEFGARSKTNPEEIALVKKLDRTILVRRTSKYADFESLNLTQ